MINHKLLALPKVYKWIGSCLPWLLALIGLSLLAGFIWGLYIAPSDYKQGEAYRIIYIHVPAAWMSMFLYVMMAGSGLVALIWRVKLAEMITVECAPVGAAMTVLALLTGMLWGKPMWGAYWVWDARLTSELILLFLYIGVINIPIIHYSVIWWNTLHQGPTVTRFDAPAVHISMLLPLLWMTVVFKLACLTAVMARVRNTIILRSYQNPWLQNNALR